MYVQYGATALILAAQEGHEKVSRMLLNRGANVNMENLVSVLLFSHFISPVLEAV